MLKNITLLILKFYQTLISPLLPPACRFYPSCSEYSRVSFTKYGFFKGLRLTIIRLCKCHPFHPGGFDPVP